VSRAAPTVQFRVGAEIFYTRDVAIERARNASRSGVMTTVVREENFVKTVIGEALQGQWRWARRCRVCLGTGRDGTKSDFTCSRCVGKGYRVD
jgi:DnaJ-class molecular chaperone